ncbi:MAG TPA: multiheme c-type cytochrome [Blastocatellia bacterium]|nr:multiheme c-type cytochrome [Blastocatellia bacterium]
MSKNKWVVKAYGDFHHDAANVNSADLPYLGELFKKEDFDKRVEEFPFINKLVSANVRPIDDAHLAPVPYVIREITLKRGVPGHKIRIGIVGFTESMPIGPNPDNRETVRGAYRIDDPFEAAKRVLPELKSKTDFIIALAYMPIDMSQRLATENPEIDTIIGARQINNTEDVQSVNRATIAYAYNQTKHLGELRVYVKADGSIENQVNRFVALDSDIPDDPAAVEVVTTAHNDFTNEQNKRSQETSSLIQSTSLLGAAESPFAGVETCAVCHQSEFEIWERTGHAHAMATLERKKQQFDTECVRCHVVGFGKGGFQSLTSTPQLANVQCESCHGPGRAHSESPAKGYGLMVTPIGCVACHTPVNSPDFNFVTYWPKVRHGAGEAAPE